jgi:hypothetical protein
VLGTLHIMKHKHILTHRRSRVREQLVQCHTMNGVVWIWTQLCLTHTPHCFHHSSEHHQGRKEAVERCREHMKGTGWRIKATHTGRKRVSPALLRWTDTCMVSLHTLFLAAPFTKDKR